LINTGLDEVALRGSGSGRHKVTLPAPSSPAALFVIANEFRRYLAESLRDHAHAGCGDALVTRETAATVYLTVTRQVVQPSAMFCAQYTVSPAERLDVTVEDQLEGGPPERRRWSARSGRLAVVTTVAVVGALVLYETNHHPKGTAGHHIAYSVTGREGARVVGITFATAEGSTGLTSNVPTPWTYVPKPNEIPTRGSLYLAAQNDPTASGSITCTITIDGAIAAKNTSQGAASVTTCMALIK
jgi:hypothetical protein